MQEDERDLLEVLTFDEIEETVGTWLRAIIQRLEKKQTAIRRDHHKQPIPSGETLRGTLLSQKHYPKCAKRTSPTELDRRRQVVPISGRSGFGNSCEGGPPLLALIPRTLPAQSSRSGLPTSCNGLFKLVGIRLDRSLCDECTFFCPASNERLRSKIGRTLIWLRRHPLVQ